MGQLILIMVPTGLLGLLAVVMCLPRVAMAQESMVVKAATATAYAGATTPAVMGLTGDQWQAIGVIGSLILGFLTWIGAVAVNVYFKRKHLELAIKLAERGETVGDEE